MKGTTNVPKFIPTPIEAAKYADYLVSFHESKRPCSVGTAVEDGRPILIYVTAFRIDSEKTFEVFIRSNASASQRNDAIVWGANLPRGGWAKPPLAWWRTKRHGKPARWQSLGHLVADPLLELEVELACDVDFDLEMQTLSGAVQA